MTISDLFTNVFSWFKSSQTTNESQKGKQSRTAPIEVDWTDSMQCNIALTKGLFHNTYPGFKLAGAMAFTPIAVPVWFMGLPVPKSEDDNIQEMLNDVIEQHHDEIKAISLICHRDGTCWVWPFFDSKTQRIVIEFIRDDSISDIIRDISTGDILEIITDELLTISTGYGKTVTSRRKRFFTAQKVSVQWIGNTSNIPGKLQSVDYRNPIGILPIPFSNNKDPNDVRGHSDYERILSDLKDYHDIDLKRSKMLAKFDVKMVQYLRNVNDWVTQNGWSSLSEINIATTDLILNLKDQEETKFEYPQNAHEAYQSALENKFRKLVEGSGIPEILWGTKVTGNHASATEQMGNLVKFVEDKRAQKTNGFTKLFTAILKLKSISMMSNNTNNKISIEWNPLDSVSADIRAKILSDFANGINKLVTVAGITKEQLHSLWEMFFPTASNDTLEDFTVKLGDMVRQKQALDTPYETAIDLEGGGSL